MPVSKSLLLRGREDSLSHEATPAALYIEERKLSLPIVSGRSV